MSDEIAVSLYTPTKQPIAFTRAHSALIRNEFKMVAKGFDELAKDVAEIHSAIDFARIYQGARASHPATRKDGTALQAGDMYFNTSGKAMLVFNGLTFDEIPAAVDGAVSPAELTAILTSELSALRFKTEQLFAALAAQRIEALAAEAAARLAGDKTPTSLQGFYGGFVPRLGTANTEGISFDATGAWAQIGHLTFMALTMVIPQDTTLATSTEVAQITTPFRPVEERLLSGGLMPALTQSATGMGWPRPILNTEGQIRFSALPISAGSARREISAKSLITEYPYRPVTISVSGIFTNSVLPF